MTARLDDRQAAFEGEVAELKRQLDACRAELREAREQRTATAEVLRVINRSAGDLAPVLDAMLKKAMHLCEAAFGMLLVRDGDEFRTAAVHGVPPALGEFLSRTPRQPGRHTAVGRMLDGEDVVQFEDMAAEPAYRSGDTRQRAFVELGGTRTYIAVALRKDGRLVGTIGAYRQEVRLFSERQIALLQNFAAQAVIAIENTRLINETREALDQQTATAEVLRVINSSPGDLAPVFQEILEKAHTLCAASFGALMTYDGARFLPVAHQGTPAAFREFLAPGIRPGPEDPFGHIVAGAAMAHIHDLAEVAARYPDARLPCAAVELGGIRTLLIVPLRKDDALVGVITAYRQDVRPFTDKQIALLQNFAAQAVIAMENARLLTETRERTRDLQESLEYQTATSEVLNLVSRSTFDLQPVLDTVCQTAARLCNSEGSAVAIRQGDVYRYVATFSFDSEWDDGLRELAFTPGRGTTTGRVLLERRVVHVEDLIADPELRDSAVATIGRRRTMLGVPLLREGDPIGVIALARNRVEPFTERQIELVRTFADQAVIAIENTRLLTELRESLEQQRAIAEVLQVINSSPGNLAPVFDAILEKAHTLCGAPYGSLQLYDGEQFRAVAVRSLSGSLAAQLKQGHRPGPRHQPLLDGAPFIHVSDIAQYGDPIARTIAGIGNRTLLYVALRKEGALLGTIVAARQEVRPFTDKQIALLQNFAAQAVIAMENARLLTETREALEQQTATAEVLQVINSSPGDLAPVFDAILKKATDLCEAAFGLLSIHDGERFRRVAARGVPPAYEEFFKTTDTPVDISTTPPARIIAGERVVQIADIAAEEAYRAGEANWRALVDLAGARSIVTVPLLKNEAVRGLITILRREARPFTDKQIALLQNFASQAVIAIENARLLTETREALEQQTATAEVLQVINSSPGDLEPVFDAILEKAHNLCDSGHGTLFLRDGDYFRPVAMRGVPEPIAVRLRSGVLGSGVPVSQPLLAGAPFVHITNTAIIDHPMLRMAAESGVRILLSVPLRKADTLLGMIVAARFEPSPFSDKQIALLQNFAEQAVIAMENARLLDEIRAARDTAEKALAELKTTQASLIHAEKMASLGQLTAGIAHEIKNPLNFVNNFAELSVELLDGLKEMAAPGIATLDTDTRAEIDDTIDVLTGNLDKISEHGRRADGIVQSMLLHSRGGSGERQMVDLNALVDEALNLAYHGARAQDQNFNITLERDFAAPIAPVELVPQDITRVFLNLIGNGFHAAQQRCKTANDRGFTPVLKVATRDLGDFVEVRVRDNGTGIAPEHRDKLFQPFFTTKPTGEGTGLGLSISYDIVAQEHGGTISVESEPGVFTEFTVRLPRR